MKIKSLLIGSSALMTASTAYAADPIVYAEPEPVEYVRVCDVYGAGFFYIPGTETCLSIRGYVRDEIRFTAGFANYTNRARFTPKFDARSDTEWGTLRSYAEIEINIDTGPLVAAGGSNIAHAFIELQTTAGTARIGRTHRPYARFLGYGSSGFTYDGVYGFDNAAEISYQFGGANGFSGIVALVQNNMNPAAVYGTNVEGGINFKQGWGSIGAIVGYDSVNAAWGAKAVARFTGGNGFSAGLHVFYASDSASTWNAYRVLGFGGIAYHANWSVLGHVSFQASPTVGFNVQAQWFDAPLLGGAWQAGASIAWTPVANLLIRPEIRYTANGAGAAAWDGVIRFQRDF